MNVHKHSTAKLDSLNVIFIEQLRSLELNTNSDIQILKIKETDSTVSAALSLINTSHQPIDDIEKFNSLYNAYNTIKKKFEDTENAHKCLVNDEATIRTQKIKAINAGLDEVAHMNEMIADGIENHTIMVDHIGIVMETSNLKMIKCNEELEQKRKNVGWWRYWKSILLICLLLVVIKFFFF